MGACTCGGRSRVGGGFMTSTCPEVEMDGQRVPPSAKWRWTFLRNEEMVAMVHMHICTTGSPPGRQLTFRIPEIKTEWRVRTAMIESGSQKELDRQCRGL